MGARPSIARDDSPVTSRHQSGRIRWGWTLGLFVIAVAFAVGVVGLWIWQDIRRFSNAPLNVTRADATFDVARGSHVRGIIDQLRRDQISLGTPFYWRVLARQMQVDSKLHAGEYELPPGITPRDLLRKMADGVVRQHHFLIVDGWTFRQLRVALASDQGLTQTLTTHSDAELAKQLGIEGDQPEGWFLPETYAWIKGESDVDVLRRAHQAMRRTLDGQWAKRADDLPLKTPYEALILASIIERETGIGSERADIAGVFTRRLKLGMKLQTDPTVIYGIGTSYDGNIRRRDLETDTPYNTYTRFGLPPTPIALPGNPAIEAALHPAPGDALYFVAIGDGSGRHVFSPNLADHNRAVSDYLKHQRRQ
ncbi:MAG: endolytic transglycosylase MltG [Dokdonella sp.]